MTRLIVLFGLLFFANSSDTQHSKVLTLTDSSLTEVLDKSEFLFVAFHAWCPCCVNLFPEFEKSAAELHVIPNLKFGKIDITKETVSGSIYNVSKYPTLILFHNAKALEEYTGAHNSEAMNEFIIKMIN